MTSTDRVMAGLQSQATKPSNKPVCRLCYNSEFKFEDGQQLIIRPTLWELIWSSFSARLIRPCNCRGSFAYAHQLCLINWLSATKHQQCDICRFQFKLRYYPKSFYDWLLQGRTGPTNAGDAHHDHSLEMLVVFNMVVFAYYQVGVGLNLSNIMAHGHNGSETGAQTNNGTRASETGGNATPSKQPATCWLEEQVALLSPNSRPSLPGWCAACT